MSRSRGATVNASGASGGGLVLIGGDFQGGNGNPTSALYQEFLGRFTIVPALTPAQTVSVDAASTINVSTTNSGNAGTAVVWSQQETDFAGSIIGTGGPYGGNGGYAEVSSHGVLSFTGSDLLTAANGAAGTLLLDPYAVTIVNNCTNPCNTISGNFTATSTSTLYNSDIDTALASGDLIISTGAGTDNSATAGSITLGSGVILSWMSGHTLTLQATDATSGGNAFGTIILNGSVYATSNPTGGTPNGGLVLEANGSITTGNINVSSLSITSSSTVSQGSSTSITATNLNLLGSGGTYTLTNSGNSVANVSGSVATLSLTDSAPLTVGPGNMVSTGGITLTDAASGGLTLTGALNGGTGPITLTADAMALTGGVTATGQTVTIQPYTAAQPINVGGTTDPGSDLFLSSADLNRVTAATLAIGNTGDTGLLTVSALSTGSGWLQNVGNLTLLAGSGGISIANRITIPMSGTLTFNSSGTVTQASTAVISGAGGLTDVGTGTVTLSAANTYSGATTIGDGTTASTLTGGALNAFSNSSALTVNVASTVDLGGFNQATFSLAGAGRVTNSGTASPAVLTIDGGVATIFSGTIQDGTSTTGLTLTGAGTGLTLSGSNTYSGATTIGDGTTASTLTGGALNAFSNSSALTVNVASTVDLGGFNQATFSLAGAGRVTNSGTASPAVLTIDGGVATIFSGTIQDGTSTTGLTLTGAGTGLTLSGSNTYSGATTIGDGTTASTLTGGALNAFSNSSALTVNVASTVDLGGFNQATFSLAGAGRVTNSGTASPAVLTIDGGVATIFSGTIQDGTSTTGLTLTGAGTGLTLSGSNTYSGATTIGDGTTASTLTGGALNAFSNSSALTVNVASTVDLGGFNQATFSLAGAGRVTNSGTASPAVLTIDGGVATIFSGTIQDGTSTTGLTLTGAGTGLTLSGSNTYSGATTIGDGTTASTLTGGALNAFSNSSALTVNVASTVDLGGFNQATFSLAGAGRVTNSGTASPAVLTIDGGVATIFSGTIQDGTSTTGLTLTGAGTGLTLSGSNTYSGATTIGDGTTASTLTGGALNAFSNSSALTVNVASTVDLGGTTQTINTVNLAGGTIQNGTLAGTVSASGGTISSIAGTANVGVTGGTVTFTADSYSGTTTVSGGTAQGSANDAFSAASATTIDGGTLNLGGFSDTISPVTMTSGTLTNGTLAGTVSASGGTISSIAGTANVGVTGGTVIFTADSYSGTTTVTGGTAKAGSGGGFSPNSAFTVSGTLDLNGFSNTIGSLAGASTGIVTNSAAATTATLTAGGNGTSTSFAGTIENTGTGVIGLTKTGAGGTLSLSGANTYTGATTITAGTLALSGSGSISVSSGVVDNSTFSISGLSSGTSITTLSGSGTVTLGANTLTLSNANGSFSGGIGGTGGLTLTTGTETLTNTNSYSGATTINGGTLALATLNGTSGSISVSSGVVDNGTFSISGLSSGTSITTLSGSGTVTLGANTLTLSSANGSFSGGISGSGGLTIYGAAFTANNMSNSFGSVSGSVGTLSLTDKAALSVGNLASTGTGGITLTDTATGGLTLTGALSSGAGPIMLTADAMALTGGVTATGQTVTIKPYTTSSTDQCRRGE